MKVTVLQVGSKLRLAIDAPKHIRISRDKENQNPSPYKKGVKKDVDSIRIGSSVKVTVLQTETGQLRFAIDTPKGNQYLPQRTVRKQAAEG